MTTSASVSHRWPTRRLTRCGKRWKPTAPSTSATTATCFPGRRETALCWSCPPRYWPRRNCSGFGRWIIRISLYAQSLCFMIRKAACGTPWSISLPSATRHAVTISISWSCLTGASDRTPSRFLRCWRYPPWNSTWSKRKSAQQFPWSSRAENPGTCTRWPCWSASVPGR